MWVVIRFLEPGIQYHGLNIQILSWGYLQSHVCKYKLINHLTLHIYL